MSLDPARVQELRELAEEYEPVEASGILDQVIALCDSWLAMVAVVEAARTVRTTTPRWTDMENALARLDAGSG